MGLIRGELEDLAFRYLEPGAFFELQKKVATKQKVFDKFLAEIQDAIREKMVESGIPAEVQVRTKRLYSLHTKIQKQQRMFDQIYDLLAVRVITDTVKNCYAALGVIHQIWRPVPGRFKDYIAMPRANLYQSLHTSVIHAGQPFEVQIRTQEMHRIAEQGVAAHWKYKDGRVTSSSSDDQRIVWMRQLIEWVQEMQEPSEFLSTLRVDLYPEEVYTFTPKGRVVVLPRGATPVDFAYAVHTEVGHQCAGAKVNGEMVPLRHTLTNGDVVEITTQKDHAPSRDWLSFVHTSRARSKIRQWIHLHERGEATDVGRRLLEKEARQAGVSLKRIQEKDWLRVAGEYGCSRADDLFAELGYGKWSARQVLAKAAGLPLPGETAEEKQPQPGATVRHTPGMGDAAFLVRGHDDLMVYRSKCCNPIPGDDIIGYVTRGRGIAVHSKSLPQRRKSSLRIRAAHPRGMDRDHPGRLPRPPAHFHRGSPRHARRHHQRHQRHGRQHPHLRKRRARPPRAHRSGARRPRPQAARTDPRRHQAHPRRLRYRARLQRLKNSLDIERFHAQNLLPYSSNFQLELPHPFEQFYAAICSMDFAAICSMDFAAVCSMDFAAVCSMDFALISWLKSP